jgi:hypothetical protein
MEIHLTHRIIGAASAGPGLTTQGADMPTPHIQRDQRRETAWVVPPSPGAVLGSCVALIDHLIAAHTQLISSYLRIGPSVTHRSRPATPTATVPHPGPPDDQSASARAHREPAQAPTAESIEARAYEIFVQRGHEPGNPVEDWRRAETELRGEMTG